MEETPEEIEEKRKWICMTQALIEENLYREMHNEWVVTNMNPYNPFVHSMLYKPPVGIFKEEIEK